MNTPRDPQFGEDTKRPLVSFETQWVTYQEIVPVVRLSRATIRRRVQDGNFPRPIQIGGLKRWSRQAIENWLAAREAEAA